MTDIVERLESVKSACPLLISAAMAEITRLREALSSETAAREKAERERLQLARSLNATAGARNEADARIADLTRKLEAAAVARPEAITTWGPHPESWFPWSPEQGKPRLYDHEKIRTQTRHGVCSDRINVGDARWGYYFSEVRSDWDIVKIGIFHDDLETLARMEAITGFVAPRAREAHAALLGKEKS